MPEEEILAVYEGKYGKAMICGGYCKGKTHDEYNNELWKKINDMIFDILERQYHKKQKS